LIDIFAGGVLPIFAIGAIGWVFGRLGTFDVATAGAINRFAFYVGIPALGFRLITHAPLEDFDYRLLVGFFATEVVMYGCGFAVGRFMFGTSRREAILLGLACALTNHILFVLPIAITLFGEEAAAPIVAIITMDSIVLFSATSITMDIISHKDSSIFHLLGKIARNPPVVAMGGGLLVALAGFEVPANIDVFLKFAGGAAAPCALFSLGVILSQKQEAGRTMLPVMLTGIKLLIHPAIAWIMLVTFFEMPSTITTPAMMVAAAPCGAMAFVLALNYQVRVDAIARAILYSSIASLLTITLAASL
jgi:malonate transporter and related proteins